MPQFPLFFQSISSFTLHSTACIVHKGPSIAVLEGGPASDTWSYSPKNVNIAIISLQDTRLLPCKGHLSWNFFYHFLVEVAFIEEYQGVASHYSTPYIILSCLPKESMIRLRIPILVYVKKNIMPLNIIIPLIICALLALALLFPPFMIGKLLQSSFKEGKRLTCSWSHSKWFST